MKVHENIQLQGARDYLKGVSLSRNPWQYAPNVAKQAAWVTGWRKEQERAVAVTKIKNEARND